MKLLQSTVLFNIEASSRYKHMAIYAPEVIDECIAGQFFYLKCSNHISPLLRRPMSIYKIVKEKDEVHFLYLIKGEGTKSLSQMQAGEKLDIFGPLGNGFILKKEWKNLLIIARGVGLATMAPLIDLATKQGKTTYAILSARSKEDILSANYMKECGAQVILVTDEDGNSDMVYVRKLIESMIDSKSIDALFTCGSKRLTNLLKNISLQYKIPGQVALEENMGCGLGMCFCCVKPFQRAGKIINLRVCSEGPIFQLEEVMEI
ncbi:dihydroorotate dehydrogenase electron transfer subunit [Sulfoacidibacillus ferrooxidans]|uniref:Dihydroorotate dehydrogenase B (NAD(+)), electron transfer subunit n=1 Tax=Sulfoacidibacillus ferrooxidans TaxID=2005001 RepID=A0A9X2ACX1_9BACL|nr:dihydroorotate dehydrogenase electron transfer subunit [Sulfoacidibacillus ferrooxidans]MCI0184239.1 Dihydroorotate dehydrogenase B (NAD(+)), electron transfer subunit [Sulfoacidibacillus ferrooxidans]